MAPTDEVTGGATGAAADGTAYGAVDGTAHGAVDGETGEAADPAPGATSHATGVAPDQPDPACGAPHLDARLKAYEGRPGSPVTRTGRDPVNLPMIRHWCEAMGDTHPAYTGPDAVAPPTMLQAWTMSGLAGRTGRAPVYEELLALLDDMGCTAVVATDCEQEYLRPLRPGDEVTYDTVIESVSARKSTRLGAGHFVTTRTDLRVRSGDLAGTHRFRILKYAPRQRSSPEPRPRPVVNRDNAGFWEGVRAHRLLIQRCTACGTLRLPWLPGCGACGCPDWDTVAAGGDGTVFSYVVQHHPAFPAFAEPDPETGRPARGPYAVCLVQLAEGVRLVSNVVGVPYDAIRVGLPVRLAFRRYDDDLVLPVFHPVPEAAA
ncbi:bifunctional MaoC family dehydratase N-terminal/OB-fold nucleic acid binding domain-containing protein [Streptomyces sp. NPDC058417]|uniref:bifunctional MaoC family dehydratase N-terminal/OB-fold nucleic acid binding domain-containing protein n=1 Tax=unclassified Streptomyces TaxID=2593676 RepID=UPI0036488C30